VPPSKTAQTESENVTRETRPNSESFVYCKGCGTQLESRSRLQKPRVVVEFMMCESCREQHGHALMPSPGSPTFCYRCGQEEEIFMEPSITPITHHVCTRCLPERAERYRRGDFATPEKLPDEAEATPKTAAKTSA
jgi:hypothetical protein